MADSDSSELSSAPSEDDSNLQLTKKDGILKFFSKAPRPTEQPRAETPPKSKREPSPPHEYVLADNPDIAFIVMFRSRFTEVFPKSLGHFGPQELERDIVDTVPGELVEHFLCALLGVLLNRKQDVKSGHYNRALEEAIQTHKSQWAKDWESKNPLSGGATFASMTPTQRLTLLKTLILWSLSSSDAVKGLIQASYKQSRHEDDLNQPLSVQPWGSDGEKRRYYLVQGLDDTNFRVYRESNYTGIKRTWFSVADDIDSLTALADKLVKEDGGQKARTLSSKIMAAIPLFESTLEKRKRREYRQARKNQFKRPEPNYSMYEGRTRGGKRVKYTYEEEDDELYSDATTSRRSTRNTRNHTPAEDYGPIVTQSGRQVKARQGGAYGESILSTAHISLDADAYEDASDELAEGHNEARPRRAAAAATTNGRAPRGGRHIAGYNDVDEMGSSEEDDASEQDYGDDEEEDDVELASDVDDEDDLEDVDEDMEVDGQKKSLVVKLPIKTPTPEKKPAVKSRMTPEQEIPKAPDFVPDTTIQASVPKHENKQHIIETTSTEVPRVSEAKRGPTSPPRTAPAVVLSPLAFRGSPEKPSSFQPPINVGSGGS